MLNVKTSTEIAQEIDTGKYQKNSLAFNFQKNRSGWVNYTPFHKDIRSLSNETVHGNW